MTMMTITRASAAGVVLAGVAVGLAGPASAEPVAGDYTATMINAGATGKQEGSTTVWILNDCGPDCTHVNTGRGPGFDLRRQGEVWASVDGDTTRTLDNNSLILTFQYTNGNPPVVIGLVKNG